MTDLFDTLHRLALADDPSLTSVELPPDGHYQTVDTTVETVTREVVQTLRSGFAGVERGEFPLFVVGWGRCRVGSTAITNLFGMAGVPAYYQPVKTAARFVLTGGTGAPWKPPVGERVVFAKEMAGPYVPYEALFNPVRCLVEAGWPVDRLHLLILDREPVASLDSWMAKWEGRIGRRRVVENFLLSTANYDRMRGYAAQVGVPVTHFPYESSRRPTETVPRLFERIGVAYQPRMLTGWGAAGDLNSDACKVQYPIEPAPYVVPGLHGTADEYHYRARPVSELTDAEVGAAESTPVRASYLGSVRACCAELGIDEPLRGELFG